MDPITIERFESLFQDLSTNPSVYYKNINHSFELSEIPASARILLSSNPDCDFPREKGDLFYKYTDSTPYTIKEQEALERMSYKEKTEMMEIPPHIGHIFCHAVGKADPRVTMIPLGRDFKNKDFFSYAESLDRTKTILCYYNVTLPPPVYHWYGRVREHLYYKVLQKPFIMNRRCEVHPRTYSVEDTKQYYRDLAASKFVLCPRGCGLDTYRMWDSLAMGCIPIVEKYEGLREFEDLPIYFVESWDAVDTFTEESLERVWREMMSRTYSLEKLTFSYWETRIRKTIAHQSASIELSASISHV